MKTFDVTGRAVYLSGKMTGDPHYQQKFQEMANMLRSHGAIVLHTADMQPGLDYEAYMTVSFSMIGVCDSIYLLGDWHDSSGARRERRFAEQLGLDVMVEGVDRVVGGDFIEY